MWEPRSKFGGTMRQLVVSLTILFSITVQGQTQELLKAWSETGYGIAELYAEADFNPQICLEKERTFAACLMALENMLQNLEENPVALVFDGISKINVVTREEEELAKTLDEYLEKKAKKRQSYMLAYQMSATSNLADLFAEVETILTTQVEEEKLAYVAGSAYGVFMKEAYDPRTAFIPQSEFTPKPNKYFGIGARIMKYESENQELNGAVALLPMAGSPAEKAGLKKGDLVLAVDGVEVFEQGLLDATAGMKGPEGTQVTLKIHSVCDNEVKDVVVTRGPIVDFPDWVANSRFISLNAVDTLDNICSGEKKPAAGEPQALYVPLNSFQAPRNKNLCAEFVGLQIKDLQNRDSVGMIFDLRNNGGGSLDVVACMLDTLIADDGVLVGQVQVVRGEIVGTNPRATHKFNKTGRIRTSQGVAVHYNKNIIVLVNGGSASASEIFAGTIQDMQRGWVVGERTVGKGSVQSYRPHRVAPQFAEPGDAPIMLGRTTAIYTLNSGRSPQQMGVIPDFQYTNLGKEIEFDENFVTSEAKSFGSIEFANNDWAQNRTAEVEDVVDCSGAKGRHGQTFIEKVAKDERYGRPFVASFQMALAKDVLQCSPVRVAAQ